VNARFPVNLFSANLVISCRTNNALSFPEFGLAILH